MPSHVRDVINAVGRPSREAVVAVAGALNASAEDQRLAAFYAEQLQHRAGRPGDGDELAEPATAVRQVNSSAGTACRCHA